MPCAFCVMTFRREQSHTSKPSRRSCIRPCPACPYPRAEHVRPPMRRPVRLPGHQMCQIARPDEPSHGTPSKSMTRAPWGTRVCTIRAAPHTRQKRGGGRRMNRRGRNPRAVTARSRIRASGAARHKRATRRPGRHGALPHAREKAAARARFMPDHPRSGSIRAGGRACAPPREPSGIHRGTPGSHACRRICPLAARCAARGTEAPGD